MATNGNGPDVRVRLSAEGVGEVVEALRQVQQAAEEARRKSEQISGAAAAVGALRNAVLGLATAAAGLAILDKMKDFAESGIEYNKSIESSTYGIAAVIYAQTNLSNAQGKVLQGQEAYNAALDMSKTLVKQLQIDALQTAATFPQLVDSFQAGLSAAIGAGITDLNKAKTLVIEITQAAAAAGLKSDMYKQEVTALLRGDLDKNATVGYGMLNLRDKDIKKWKEAGVLFEELHKRLQPFALAAANATQSFEIMASNVKDGLGKVAGEMNKGLFDKLKETMGKSFDAVITKTGEIVPALQPVVDAINGISYAIGTGIANGIAWVIEMTKEFGAWLESNKEAVDDVKYGFDKVWTATKDLLTNLFTMLDFLEDGKTKVSLFEGVWRVALVAVAAVSDAISGIKLVLLAVGSVLMTAVIKPFGKLISLAGGAADAVGLGFGKAMERAGNAMDQGAGIMTAKWQAEGQKLMGQKPALVKALEDIAKAKERVAVAGTLKKPATPQQLAGGNQITGLRNPPDKNDKKKKEKANHDAERLAKATSETMQAAAENELKILEARNKLAEQKDKEMLEAGLLSLEAYFAARKKALEDQGAAEQKILDEKMAAAKTLPTENPVQVQQRLKAIAAVKTEQTLKDIKNEQALAAVETEKLKALRALNIERLEMDEKIFEMQGKKGEAASIALDIEIQKTDELLKKLGKTNEEREKVLGMMRTQGNAKIDYDQANTDGSQAFAALEREKKRIENDVASGKLFEFEGEQKILDIQRQRIPVLEKIAKKLKDAAIASGDVARIQAAEEFAASIDDLKVKTDQWGQSLAQLKQVGFDAAVNGFADALMDIGTGAKGVGEAFKAMGASIAQAMAQMLSQMIAMQAMKALFSSFGFGLPGFANGGQVGAVHAATGGYISGPGTSTSDSIPAMLSDGEFVVRAKAVQQPGVLEHLRRLNTGVPSAMNVRQLAGVSRFADGGLVGAADAAPGGDHSSLTVGLAPGLVLQELKTAAGKRALVEMLGEQKKTVRKILQ